MLFICGFMVVPALNLFDLLCCFGCPFKGLNRFRLLSTSPSFDEAPLFPEVAGFYLSAGWI